MLDALRRLIASLTGAPAQRFASDDYRLATAALFLHVISLDGDPAEVELRRLQSGLEAFFNIDANTAWALVEAAAAIEGDDIGLDRFVNPIRRALPHAGRLRVVEMIWDLVYADERMTEFEDSLVWRAAELLGVSAAESEMLRQRVLSRRQSP